LRHLFRKQTVAILELCFRFRCCLSSLSARHFAPGY